MTKLEDVALRIAEKQMAEDQAKAVYAGHDIMLSIEGYMPWAREIARVAIKAMRDPTQAMVDAGYAVFEEAYDPGHCYSMMIAAALAENPEEQN